ncbi:MAG: Fic family protein [Candidatus Omnitrophota bacterium]|jgi:Fic family protein|nr:MAG: Fic family protein [Candidatus Omnitrophota bacterium]
MHNESIYKYKFIEDLPNHLMRTENPELDSLRDIWNEQANRLKENESIKQFNERMKREWAIETGILENLYSLDRGVTELLIEKGIEASLISHGSTDKPPEIVATIIRDQKEALDFIFDYIRDNRELTTSFIKELHSLLTRNQNITNAVDQFGVIHEVELIKGEWKKQSNNPKRPDGKIHEYCPPEHVSAEMDKLISLHKINAELHISTEIQAAWLHHRFTQIHPFQDGNGRVARGIASLIFIKANWFPLVIHRDQRADYIEVCEQADNGDLNPLIDLFAKIQKKSFLKALSISEDVLRKESTLTLVLEEALSKLVKRNELEKKEKENVFIISRRLEEGTYGKLNTLKDSMRDKILSINSDYHVSVEKSDPSNHYWFKKQIVAIARQFDYFADTRTYARWFRFKIIELRQTEILLCFHSLGVEFVGIIAVSAFIEYRDADSENTSLITIDGPYPACKEIFQFTYQEKETLVDKRYNNWLEDVLIMAMDQWRRQL